MIVVCLAAVNILQGHTPLFTAAVLGNALLGEPSTSIAAAPVAVYNGLHLVVFLVLGMSAAWIAGLVERHPQLWYLLLFLGVFAFFHLFGAVAALAALRRKRDVALPRARGEPAGGGWDVGVAVAGLSRAGGRRSRGRRLRGSASGFRKEAEALVVREALRLAPAHDPPTRHRAAPRSGDDRVLPLRATPVHIEHHPVPRSPELVRARRVGEQSGVVSLPTRGVEDG